MKSAILYMSTILSAQAYTYLMPILCQKGNASQKRLEDLFKVLLEDLICHFESWDELLQTS